jgi:uncharacterized coiled-coil protein SlyX
VTAADRLLAVLAEIDGEVEALRETVVTQGEALQVSAAKIADLTAQRDSLLASADAYVVEIARLTEQRDTLIVAAGASAARIADLEARLANATAEKAVLLAEITSLNADVAAYDVEYDKLEAKVVTLTARIADLEARPVCPEPALHSPWEPLYDVDLADPTGWVLETGQPSNANGYDLPRNVTFSSAGLRVVGKREAYSGRAYTSGDARGQHLSLPQHFRVEVIARGAHERGVWPCILWFRPLGSADGEIDINENFGGQPRAHATLHSEYSDDRMISGKVPWTSLPNPDPAALHTYVMEKTPNRLLITIDGLTLLDANPATRADFPWARIFEDPAKRWYPRVTMQIGCHPTNNPACATGQPASTWQESDLLVTSLRFWSLRD